MKQSYIDRLRNSYKDYEANKWAERSRKCLHHIVAAVCFRETAESIYQSQGSVILPTIGFYYSLFHVGISGLFVEYSITLEQLERIKHSRLKELINTYLVRKGFVAPNFLDLLNEARNLRELVNYPFVVDGYDQRVTRLKIQVGELYKNTESAFDEIINHIEMVSTQVNGGIIWYIRSGIGDVVGDEFYDTYLSKIDRQRVIAYLVSKGLTT